MNPAFIIARLETNRVAIYALVTEVGDEQARWKPSADAWSILEVINHLGDEEREDFRQRVDFTLHQQGEVWPPIDPPGWVTERRYNERDPADSLGRFLDERARSLEWLEGLTTPDWSLSYDHPAAGRLIAGDLLASWVAHDLLHIRQLAGLHHAYLSVAAPGREVRYAGDW